LVTESTVSEAIMRRMVGDGDATMI
jgi:hypothetical protein